jgi:tetratricopeptide (TPR) repeat protein
LFGIGNVYLGSGEYRQSLQYYEQSLQILRTFGDPLGEGDILWTSALALDRLGDRPEAIDRAEAALKIYEAIESPHASKVRDQLAKWRGEDKASGEIG